MVGRYGVRRYRLIIYPAGTGTADRRLARLWRAWPLGGAVLGLLAVMLLGNAASSPDTVLAVAVAAYVSIGALLFCWPDRAACQSGPCQSSSCPEPPTHTSDSGTPNGKPWSTC